MPEYRLYVLTGDGHIERVEEFHASDDGDALMLVKSIKKRVPCELWHHDCLIAKLPAYEAK